MDDNILANNNLNGQDNVIEDVIDDLEENLWDADEHNEAEEQFDEVIN